MHLEKDKPFWLSRNNLIYLFSVYEFQQKISNVVVHNSNDFQNLKPLDSLVLHNANLIILESSDYDIYLSLPFPFSENFTHLNEIIDFIKSELEIVLFFIELGSWVIGNIKFLSLIHI